jgi:hypothetical protein
MTETTGNRKNFSPWVLKTDPRTPHRFHKIAVGQ